MSFLCTRCSVKFSTEGAFVVHACQLPVAELSNMIGGYSLDAYGGDWGPCIKMLRRDFKLGDRAIEAVLRSKWTRWAGDMSNNSYGEYTSADLKRFMDDPRNRVTQDEIAKLTAETFS